MRGTKAIICGLVLFVAGGFFLERSAWFVPLKQSLRCQTVPTGLLGYGAMGKVIKDLGLVKAVENDYSRFPKTLGDVNINIPIFQKQRQVGTYLFAANPGGIEEFPSSRVINEECFREGWPLISIVADHNDLYGYERGIAVRKGLVPPAERKGLEWERFASISYYEHGKLLFATGAGLRTHGQIAKSFRLYFRDEYGADQFKSGVLFDSESQPIKRLVVHDDYPHGLHFTTSLAFDIARQIGCVVPEAKPVIFFLNGKSQGLYWISEHLSKKQWESHFKHDNFLFFVIRVKTIGIQAAHIEN